VITIDTHDDIPANFATEEVDPGERGERQVDLPKMREGGLDAAFFIVYVGQTERTPENYEAVKTAAVAKFDAIHRMTDALYPDQIELAYSSDDVERINAEGRLVACIGIENGYAIGRELGLLERYHELGARYMTLSHNGHNDICDSANPSSRLGDEEEEHGGVSEFGEQVIEEMNRLGIMVDISHTSRQSMLDAARLSRAPIIASHSSASALADVSRNLDDEQLLALKENGGVIQIVALGAFVKEDPAEKTEVLDALRQEMGMGADFAGWSTLSDEQRAQYRARRREIEEMWPITVADFVDHIDHGRRRRRPGVERRQRDLQRHRRARAPRLHGGGDPQALGRQPAACLARGRAGGGRDAGGRNDRLGFVGPNSTQQVQASWLTARSS
jgi:membrane dipeptidase